MSFDAFTLSAVSVVVLLGFLLVVVTAMAARPHPPAPGESPPPGGAEGEPGAPRSLAVSRANREFCGAIHRLYPNARVGLDFLVKKEGKGFAIAEWLLPTAVPSPICCGLVPPRPPETGRLPVLRFSDIISWNVTLDCLKPMVSELAMLLLITSSSTVLAPSPVIPV